MEERIERPQRKRKLPARFDNYSSLPSGQDGKKMKVSQPAKPKPKAKSRLQLHPYQRLVSQLGIDDMRPEDYIPSEIDRPRLVRVSGIDLLKSFHGRGLIARQDIAAGTCIGEYTGRFFSQKEFEAYVQENDTADGSYAMTLGKKVIDAKDKGNFTRYMNFSDSQANMMFVNGRLQGKPVVKVKASKDIKAGEQLLVDYNVYDAKASSDFVFLNPEDTDLSAEEFLRRHQNHYLPMTLSTDLVAIGLSSGTTLMGSRIVQAIANNDSLSEKNGALDVLAVNLPVLVLDSEGRLNEFSNADTFTPLMLAAYLGQVENVNWLVDKGARIDRQQNQSGNCALFYALQGYQEAKSVKQQSHYLSIIRNLIAKKADCGVHDRHDNTFLHKALAILSEEDFKAVIKQLNLSQPENFKALFSYINSADKDVILTCVEERKMSRLKILMESYPDYFQDSFKRTNPERQFNRNAFFKAVQSYQQEEKKELLSLLPEKDVKWVPEL